MVPDHTKLDEVQIAKIKHKFQEILDGGAYYDIDEIESWFLNEGSWSNKTVRTRIVNLAHYTQSRHEQKAVYTPSSTPNTNLNIVEQTNDSCSENSSSCGCGDDTH